MGLVFISYRRSDASDFAKRMASELTAYFGSDTVFFDQTTASPGTKWPQKLRETLEAADAVLIVIGPRWLRAQDEDSGRRRIDLKDDWVRQEIITTLRRQEDEETLGVVPILVGDTPMPHSDDLDEELSPLCQLQALRLPNTGSPHDFHQVKDQLVRFRFEPRIHLPVSTPRYGKAPPQLSEKEEEDFLAEWKEWEIVETPEPLAAGGFRRELHRVYEFPTFELAFQFMNEVVTRGIEPYNHHPRWENTFTRVEVWLTTFNLNYKPSKRDMRLAMIFEEVWKEFKSTMTQMSI